jgi:hypothetical protein
MHKDPLGVVDTGNDILRDSNKILHSPCFVDIGDYEGCVGHGGASSALRWQLHRIDGCKVAPPFTRPAV